MPKKIIQIPSPSPAQINHLMRLTRLRLRGCGLSEKATARAFKFIGPEEIADELVQLVVRRVTKHAEAVGGLPEKKGKAA